ncbi:MAG: hypothetical protein HWD61_08580 [Parachlamydiaceae bacterium]|nr:MAG: hypothetical protein HWD61_08580 [Parachlamydiaceae bacterium]
MKESSLPALKQEVDLFRLERMFNEINFVDPQKVNYRTPSTLNDEGRPINPSILKNSLSNLLDNIKNNSRIAFAPSSDTERKKWYGNIALYLKHILLLLEKLPVENRTEYLIDLALVGSHCGGRYIGECLLTYQLLSGQMMDFSQQILSQLSSMRSGIAASIAPNKSDDFQVHAINAVIAKIGEAKGLPGYDFALQDKGIKYVQVRPADLTFQFDQHYSPATVLERVADEINNHSIGSTGQSSYERALDWFKDHIPEDWTPKNRNYSELFKQLEELSQRDASRQEISEFLLENDIGGSVITPEESRIAKELRILKDQYQELERIESHLKEETEDTNLYRELWKEKLVEFQMSDQLSQKREVILEGLKTKIENTLLSYGQLKQKTSSQEIVKLAKSLIENERKKAFLEEIVENPLDKTKK